MALAVAVFAVRHAFVDAFAETLPSRAAALWADHPRTAISLAMEDIGQAAARRTQPDADVLAEVAGVARLDPLAPQPFMVRGIEAQVAGNLAVAERAFREAEIRAPREPAPHYFLAQHYLTTGRPDEGLREIAVLARLVPNGIYSLAPFLAQYARSDGAVPHLRMMFRSDPTIANAVLSALASDAVNADLVLALARPGPAPDGSLPDWITRLLGVLVSDGQFERAHRLWSAATGLEARRGIFDPGFRGSKAPPPFNWTLASGAAGLAEPDAGGLHVIYYGREDAAVASQLLLLAPGDYRFEMQVAGSGPGIGALAWIATCLPSNAKLLALRLDRAGKSGTLAASLRVPANGCGAQRLELFGTAPEMPQQADVTISGLRLEREGGR